LTGGLWSILMFVPLLIVPYGLISFVVPHPKNEEQLL